MGDPSGIGPEIIAKAYTDKLFPKNSHCFVIGSYNAMKRAAQILSADFPMRKISSVDELDECSLCVLDKEELAELPEFGKQSAQTGKASFNWIISGIDLALQKKIDAIVTGPISKTALHMAGIDFPGHTEILAHFTKCENWSMMFMLDNVCVTHVTTHCSLRDAIDLVKLERVLNHIRLLHETLCGLGIKNPRIAVGGLNPHAGEGGLFGREEIDEIVPAIDKAVMLGMNVTGPYPPDTVFHRAFGGEFDGVVSMLHDHGFVALKSKDFDHGVNITVGLPIIRTSVGHGTAFDIAGSGIASEKSLVAAINAAMRLSSSF